jgi:predicted Zn-dependent protease
MLAMLHSVPILIITCLFVYGCAVNPVTGKNELAIIPESSEINIGTENYVPGRQMQGGDYTVDPKVAAYVNEVGQKLVAVSDRKLPYEFVVLNNGTPNAWALPGGKIAVNRGLLLELNSEAELAAVLGHEIVHAAARHGARRMEKGIILQGALIATGIAARDSDYGSMIVGGAKVAAGLIQTRYSREDEREADFYGMQYMSRSGYDPMAAVYLQETFVRLQDNQSSNWLAGLFASHPPSLDRVQDNRETVSRLPQGGKVGSEIYRQRTASLVTSKRAYESYDIGREYLENGDAPKARAYAQEAIKIEPREARFYALRGDTHFLQERYSDALADYNRAIERNDNYFYFYLQRGQARKKLNLGEEAFADLEKSTRLLPTAKAYNSMGELELARGNRQKAIRNFAEAATSDSPLGIQARTTLLKLDFPGYAGRYFDILIGLEPEGYLQTRISNRGPVGIRNLQLLIIYPGPAGEMLEAVRTIDARIAPGQIYFAALDLGPFKSASSLNAIRIEITGAELLEQ